MPPRPTARWLLVGSLVLAPALTGHAAPDNEERHRDLFRRAVDAALVQSLEPEKKTDDQGEHLYQPLYASTDPSSEKGREVCFNEKSLPWLPEVSLPDAKSPGRDALGWRPRWLLSEPSSHPWLLGALTAALLASVLDLALRRRGPQGLSTLAASAPAVAGFALAHRHLSFLAEGLSQTWWCIPREGIFQRNAQLARDTLTLGTMASLSAFLWLLLLSWLTRRPSNLRTHVPAFALLSMAAWLTWRHWPDGREGELAQDVSRANRGVEAAGVRLPDLAGAHRMRLPDVPLLLIRADGELRYDDSRGQQAPTALPLVLPPGGSPSERPMHRDEDDRPPFFLLAIDERATWQVVQQALDPFGEPDFIHHQGLLFGPNASAIEGSAPRAMVMWSYYGRSHCVPHSKLSLSGLLSDDGLRLFRKQEELGSGCELTGAGPAIAREHLDRESLSRCFDHIVASASGWVEHSRPWLPRSVDVDIRLKLSPGTLWREIALIKGEVKRRPIDSSLEIQIEGISSGR